MKKTVLFLLCSINLFAYRVENIRDREVIIYPNKVMINESLELKDDGDKKMGRAENLFLASELSLGI